MSSAWGKAWGGSWGVSWGRLSVLLAIRFLTLRSIVRYGMADQLDLEILQGDSFDWEIWVQDADGVALDLTNFNLRGMGRQSYADALPAFTFVCTKDADQTANAGKVMITLSAIITAAVAAKKYVYDIEIYTAGGSVKKLFKGNALVLAEATK